MMTPERILARFDIGPIDRVEPVTGGLIHGTWKVVGAEGAFALQRLHPKLASDAIVADYAAVTAYLAERGFSAPRLVPTLDGARLADDREGRRWRLSTWVSGQSKDRVTTAAEAEQGARMLGRFHRVMADLPHVFQSTHPLHDTVFHLGALRAALLAHPTEAAALADEVAQVEAALPVLILSPNLPRRVVHGDPKISNILFDANLAVSLVDLDTCARHSVLVDLGDAVRSWCRDGGEDEAQGFHLDRFLAVLEGYAAEGPALSPEELALLPDAGRLITLELAARFLRDCLEDEYFAFDANRYPSRYAHNLARARGMLHLAREMAAARAAQAEAVARLF